MDLGLLEIEIAEAQDLEWLVLFAELFINIIDEKGPQLSSRVMEGV